MTVLNYLEFLVVLLTFPSRSEFFWILDVAWMTSAFIGRLSMCMSQDMRVLQHIGLLFIAILLWHF